MHRWDEVLVNQGEVLIMVSTTRLHASPPGPTNAGGPVHAMDPRHKAPKCGANAAYLELQNETKLKRFLGALDERHVSTLGQTVFMGLGGGVCIFVVGSGGFEVGGLNVVEPRAASSSPSVCPPS